MDSIMGGGKFIHYRECLLGKYVNSVDNNTIMYNNNEFYK